MPILDEIVKKQTDAKKLKNAFIMSSFVCSVITEYKEMINKILMVAVCFNILLKK
jgi:hypothetical protein